MNTMNTSEKYDSEPKDDESTTSLLSSDDTSSYETGQKSRKNRSWTWLLVLCVSLILTNAATSVVTYRTASRNHHSLAEPPTGVPNIFRNLPLVPKPTLLNVTFYDREDSVYRKRASLEADVAWTELTRGDAGVMLVPKEDAKQSDIDPEKHAYWDAPEKGLEGYPVGVEVLHQLHCLNLLRKNMWFNIDFSREQAQKDCPDPKPPNCGGTPELIDMHIDHCIDFLRRRLMCTSDLGVVPLFWLGREGRMTADMSRMHTCRNYNTVLQLVKEKGISMPEEGSVKPKADDPVVYDYI